MLPFHAHYIASMYVAETLVRMTIGEAATILRTLAKPPVHKE